MDDEKEEYRGKIIEMIEKIERDDLLRKIYSFIIGLLK